MRGRFAPSPTGRLHLGNLRTALVAWLCARAADAPFLLRIDDLDPDRSRPEHERRQLADLAALGIDFDGTPVRQSERFARYESALGQLAALDATYPCFCSRAEVLAAATAPHGAGLDAPYPGTCARIDLVTARRRIDAGEAHCIRVRTDDAAIAFHDTLLGTVSQQLDDFIVRRRDGVPAYNLASPIDESDMDIEEVVRGADLAPNTPRQVWIAERLSLHVPRFTHVPMVLGPDGSRLAKRHGSIGLGDDPAAVLALLARSLGPAIDTSIVDPGRCTRASDLLPGFDRALLPRTPWRLDVTTGQPHDGPAI